MTTTKQNIKTALQRFIDGDLADNARNLLNVLGYRSQRTLSLEPNTADGFIEHFDSHNTMNRERGLLSDWESIDFLFQLTEDEITQTEGSESNQNGFASYLFFALKLENHGYTRTQLSNITREINKLFAMPAMIIFQHSESLTFAVIDRQWNRIDKFKDGYEKVTLIEHIDSRNPHDAHIDLLYCLSISELYRQRNFSDFPEFHDAWEKTLDTLQLCNKYYKEITTWYFSPDDQVTFPDGVDPADAWFQIGCARSELTELKINNSIEHLYTDEKIELFDGTIAAYRKAIEIQSDHARARRSLAELLVDFAFMQTEDITWPSDYSRAINWCEKAIEACPDFAYAYYQLIETYDSLMEHAEIDDWDDSILTDQIGVMSFEIAEARIEVCQKLTKIQPNDATAYYELGKACIRSIRPEIELADEYGDEGKDEIEAMKQGKHPRIRAILEKAIKAYGAAINVKLDYAAAYNELAKAHHWIGRFEDAIQNYKQAIALGNLYCRDKARRGWEPRYIEIASWDFYDLRERNVHQNLAEAYHDLGKLYFADENFMEAIECYHNAIIANSHFDGVCYDLAVTYDETGAYELAIVWYDHVRHAYEYPDYHYRFGKALHRTRRYEEAEKEYQKAINRKEAIEEEYDKNIFSQMAFGYFKSHDMEPLQCPAWWEDVYRDLECAANNVPPCSS